MSKRFDLSGKVALVTGVGDNLSFAWFISKTLQAAGAKIVLACHPRMLGIVEGLLRIADAIGQRVVARGPASLADVEVLAAMGCTTVMTALDVSAVRLHARTVLPDTTAQRATAESLVLR